MKSKETDPDNLTSKETDAPKEPKFNLPISGTLTLSELKEKYAAIEKAVRDKDHLLTGVVTKDFDLSGLKFSLRTLRKRESDAFQAQAIVGTPETDVAEFLANQSYRLVLTLTRVEGEEWSTPTLSPDTLDTWLASSSVTSRIAYIQDWDASLVELLLLMQQELEQVKSIILHENLKNQ